MATKVALAGATGNIGLPVLNSLLAAGFPVTVLTRKGSNSTSRIPKDSKVTIREVDYSDVSSLTEALKGVDVVVSTLATQAAGEQTPLIDAAVAAGVTRFIPSEFGSDTANPKTAQLPVFKGKVDTVAYLKTKVEETAKAGKPSFSYTQIFNGPFFDWGLRVGFIVNPAQHSAVVYNGGDVPFSTSTLDTIGQAVVGVIRHLGETANRPVYVQDALVTQNQLIQYAKDKDGIEWSITHKDTEKVKEESLAELAKGFNGPALGALISTAIYNKEYGGNYTGHLDNDLLGIKGLSDAEVRKLVESLL
ncbi:hypothetical protein A1O3_02342 [Capronia epimyces CBS 606.96]|uniref:NmrA-like domain-containing protein n=1 Tax=Capronia epimyces CBS 606.96 TaxID=1182542 RepID=W9YJ45_9EURO|nr:uncharacterized protein A1O3_02342 [Capronia epimyces CBS 606.96]EXJ89276.1 hypothetical protein A1O3_02342 [Capronia epimyces CBS 606.96]